MNARKHPTPDTERLVSELLADALAPLFALLDGRDPDDHHEPDQLAQLVAERLDVPAIAERVATTTDDNLSTLHAWVGREQLVSVAHQHQREREPVDAGELPCPAWCDREHGHPFDTFDNGYRRIHEHRFGDRATCVAVELRERTPAPGTGLSDLRTDLDALTVRVHFGQYGTGYLTGDGARRLATQLVTAADLYDTERDQHATTHGT